MGDFSALSILVTRDLVTGSPADLELEDPANGLEVVHFGDGDIDWYREEAGGHAHGELGVFFRQQNRTGMIVERIKATTMATLLTRIATVEAAFAQRTYTVTPTINSAAFPVWNRCQPAAAALADIAGSSTGGLYDRDGLSDTPPQVVKVFTVRRLPT